MSDGGALSTDERRGAEAGWQLAHDEMCGGGDSCSKHQPVTAQARYVELLVAVRAIQWDEFAGTHDASQAADGPLSASDGHMSTTDLAQAAARTKQAARERVERGGRLDGLMAEQERTWNERHGGNEEQR